jgi:hypothetical protein
VERPLAGSGVVERNRRPMEEFIAVVFGNEVWMGLVDFKSDKPPMSTDNDPQDDYGNSLCLSPSSC